MSNSLRHHGLYSSWNYPLRILEWVAFPFSRESLQSRDQIQVSCIAGEFFTSCVTKGAQEYWSGQPIPSPADLPNPGIELESPALQVDSLPPELFKNKRMVYFHPREKKNVSPFMITSL